MVLLRPQPVVARGCFRSPPSRAPLRLACAAPSTLAPVPPAGATAAPAAVAAPPGGVATGGPQRRARTSRAPPVVYGGAGAAVWTGDARPAAVAPPPPPQGGVAEAPPEAAGTTDSAAAAAAATVDAADDDDAAPAALAAPSDGDDEEAGPVRVLLAPPEGYVSPLRAAPGETLAQTLSRKLRARRAAAQALVAGQLRGEAGSAAAELRDNGLTAALDFTAMAEHEVLVHAELGVCRFAGLRSLPDPERPEAGRREYVFLTFSDGQRRLNVTTASRLLHRYSAVSGAAGGGGGSPGGSPPSPTLGGKPPRLSAAGNTAAWRKRRLKARAAALALVGGALAAYVERIRVVRPPLPRPPHSLRAAFAAGFPHPLTAGQVEAIEAVTTDLCDRDEARDCSAVVLHSLHPTRD